MRWFKQLLLTLGVLMAAAVVSSSSPGCSPSRSYSHSPYVPGAGASPAFTTDDARIQAARKLYEEGKFTDAERALAQINGDSQAKTDLTEIMRRRRQEYALTRDALVAKVRKDIPDVTAADIDRWQSAGALRFRTIDGQTFFFNREPQGLYLFADEAKDRRDKHAEKKPDPTWKLIDHLARVVEEAEKTGKVEVLPVHHSVTYSLTIAANRPGAKKGSLVRVWLPYPQEYRQQRNLTLISTSPATGFVAPNAVKNPDGKREPIVGAAQRTIYLEQRIEDPTQPIRFEEKFEFDCYAYYPQLDDAKVQPLPAGFPSEYLAERPPHIVFTPEIRSLAASIVGNETNSLAKARKIFHWVDANIRWHPEEEYSTIPCLPLQAIACKRGDCGMQSMTLITLCRAVGVPARWQSCWETKPLKSSMHDWTEIYVEPWGWLPVDPSYGVQKDKEGKNPHPDPRIRDFYFGHQDSYRIISNLDYGATLYPTKASLRSETVDFQRGEVEIDGRNLYFDEWGYKMDFVTTPENR